ncbi:protein refolding chaperone Spy/CpxP family [Noviherbaspirillum humi]|uniref:Protein refolding chaperone Spy/CpxP family n=1 Tax=Noviherbaspirillum humi TaxID=1688639 RepID=A0A239HNV8_9BURK|nr:Spy/CpxP family protein refolding chaperone [Noviherbaspirillum humi]SNS83036.1 protein refolding chaperone Spy/CpxP family [Noviherbaspirillum humi]
MTTPGKNVRHLLVTIALAMPVLASAQSAPGPQPSQGAGPSLPLPPPAMHGMAHGHDSFGGMPPYLRGLNLDEAQRDKVFAILHAQAPQLREQQKAHDKARQALADLVRSGQYSEGRAKQLADALARSATEIELMRARSDSQILALLTAEQRARMERMPRMSRPQEGHERRAPPGAPGA